MIDIILQYHEAYFRGLVGTLKLAGATWLIGLLLGSFIGAISFFGKVVISNVIKLLSLIVSASPVVVLLFWFHYPAQAIFQVAVDPFYTSLYVLSFINVVSVAVIVEHGFSQVHRGFLEVADCYGVTKKQIVIKILLPMVLRNILPSILTAQLAVLHMTIFASLISFEELFRVSQQINSVIYKPVEVYSILAIFFLVISIPITLISNRLKGSKFVEEN